MSIHIIIGLLLEEAFITALFQYNFILAVLYILLYYYHLSWCIIIINMHCFTMLQAFHVTRLIQALDNLQRRRRTTTHSKWGSSLLQNGDYYYTNFGLIFKEYWLQSPKACASQFHNLIQFYNSKEKILQYYYNKVLHTQNEGLLWYKMVNICTNFGSIFKQYGLKGSKRSCKSCS